MTDQAPTDQVAKNVDIPRNFISLLGQINRQWRKAVDRRLQPLGLSEATWLPLLHIARADTSPRQKDLASSLGLDSSSVVRLLDGLQAAGYIQRLEGVDRREKIVHLTDSGQRIVGDVERIVQEGKHHVFASIDDTALRDAFVVLQQVAGRIEALGETIWERVE